MNRFARRLLLALFLAVLVYGAFVLYTGFHAIGASLAAYHWGSFGIALALATGNYLLRFAKWQYYLRRLQISGISVIDSFLIFLSGFVLTVTPGKVGEVFKSAVLWKTHGVPVAKTAPIVVAERLTDVIGVIVLIVAGSTAFAGGLGWALAGTIAVALGLTAVFWARPVLAALTWMATRGGRLALLAPKLRDAYTSLQLVAAPRALWWPTLLSLLGWGAEGVALYVILDGFEQVVPVFRAVFFYCTATLAGALVPVPGGLGIVESIIREQLVRLSHVPEGPATASMLLIRFATLWWAVLVGFVALACLRVRYPRELGDSEAIAASAR